MNDPDITCPHCGAEYPEPYTLPCWARVECVDDACGRPFYIQRHVNYTTSISHTEPFLHETRTRH